MSYKKLDGREDEPQAAFAGIRIKLLIRPVVEKQLGDFGVDPECASYTQINQPSGGTKMKFVLAAAKSTFFESTLGLVCETRA